MRAPVILMVEDNPADALLVTDALQAIGYACTLVRADNAIQAFQVLLQRGRYEGSPKPDLVLLDLKLPVIDGHRFLEIKNADPVFRDVPVVVLTSSQRGHDAARSMALGARDHWVKPNLWAGYLETARRIRGELEAAAAVT